MIAVDSRPVRFVCRGSGDRNVICLAPCGSSELGRAFSRCDAGQARRGAEE